MRIPIKLFKQTFTPAEPAVPNAFYIVATTEDDPVAIYVTNASGHLRETVAPEFIVAIVESLIVNTAPILLSSTVVNLNEATEAKQALYTVPALRRSKPSWMEIDFLSGVPTNAEFTIGWNAGANNVLADPFHLADLITDTSSFGPLIAPGRSILAGAAGQSLGLKVTTAEGSALTARINHFGYLTDASGVPIANIL